MDSNQILALVAGILFGVIACAIGLATWRHWKGGRHRRAVRNRNSLYEAGRGEGVPMVAAAAPVGTSPPINFSNLPGHYTLRNHAHQTYDQSYAPLAAHAHAYTPKAQDRFARATYAAARPTPAEVSVLRVPSHRVETDSSASAYTHEGTWESAGPVLEGIREDTCEGKAYTEELRDTHAPSADDLPAAARATLSPASRSSSPRPNLRIDTHSRSAAGEVVSYEYPQTGLR